MSRTGSPDTAGPGRTAGCGRRPTWSGVHGALGVCKRSRRHPGFRHEGHAQGACRRRLQFAGQLPPRPAWEPRAVAADGRAGSPPGPLGPLGPARSAAVAAVRGRLTVFRAIHAIHAFRAGRAGGGVGHRNQSPGPGFRTVLQVHSYTNKHSAKKPRMVVRDWKTRVSVELRRCLNEHHPRAARRRCDVQ